MTDAEARVGRVAKGWRLDRLLGVGAATAAYEASRNAERAVVRVLAPSSMPAPEGPHASVQLEAARTLFLRGAYAANRFQHPRVVPIVADGVDEDGAPFVVRPFVEARTLGELLRASTNADDMSEAKALRTAEQLLDALECAHAHGVIHGAIHPENVLVTPRGSIRLVDFATPPGGAGQMGGDVQMNIAPRKPSPFVAPELLAENPKGASESSDVFAVGACLAFALTGEAPATQAGAAYSLKTVRPTASEYVASVVDCALAADPEHRYSSAYAMLGDVRRVLSGRKPKLEEAEKPIPSGMAILRGAPTSKRAVPASMRSSLTWKGAAPLSSPAHTIRGRALAARAEWRGNVLLILAIALLAGVATFVVVREKVEEERSPQSHAAPSDHDQARSGEAQASAP